MISLRGLMRWSVRRRCRRCGWLNVALQKAGVKGKVLFLRWSIFVCWRCGLAVWLIHRTASWWGSGWHKVRLLLPTTTTNRLNYACSACNRWWAATVLRSSLGWGKKNQMRKSWVGGVVVYHKKRAKDPRTLIKLDLEIINQLLVLSYLSSMASRYR